ncbi:hypothetical protein [Paenibacillus sp. y28]|uniref:hypothetical protein n=1 Tax=Paenibacillus sp. y28 TaxID=3129110 RepID=UPI00301745DA
MTSNSLKRNVNYTKKRGWKMKTISLMKVVIFTTFVSVIIGMFGVPEDRAATAGAAEGITIEAAAADDPIGRGDKIAAGGSSIAAVPDHVLADYAAVKAAESRITDGNGTIDL